MNQAWMSSLFTKDRLIEINDTAKTEAHRARACPLSGARSQMLRNDKELVKEESMTLLFGGVAKKRQKKTPRKEGGDTRGP